MPALVPQSDTLLYTVVMKGGRARVVARKLTGGDPVTVADGGIGPQYMRHAARLRCVRPG
jgi:hypothetical protein